MFFIYVSYVLIIYFFIWRVFVRRLMKEVWRTKSMLW